MGEQPSKRDRYLKLFDEHVRGIDALQRSVLNGHLIVETVLDNIISNMFSHPEYVRDARLSFEQKVRLVRAYGLHDKQDEIWGVILAINGVRNDIAHNLASEKRTKKWSCCVGGT